MRRGWTLEEAAQATIRTESPIEIEVKDSAKYGVGGRVTVSDGFTIDVEPYVVVQIKDATTLLVAKPVRPAPKLRIMYD